MAWNPLLYCAICWQEFDNPAEHNSGSLLSTRTGNQRLDGLCKGDIRKVSDRPKMAKFQRQSNGLELDSGDPIVIA